MSFSLPRRSLRIGPKRWTAHFAKVAPIYNEERVTESLNWIVKTMNIPFQKRVQKFPGANDLLTHRSVYYILYYNTLMNNPYYLIRSSEYYEEVYIKTLHVLNFYEYKGFNNRWVKNMKATIHDFLHMCKYIHLLK